MEILDRAKSFHSDVVEGKLAAEDAKRSALGGNVAGNSDAGVGAGIGKAGGEGRGMRIMISAHGALDQALIYHMKKKDKIEQFWEGGLLPNCGIDIIEYDPETHEYTFKEEMLYYYDKELFEKVPRLLK